MMQIDNHIIEPVALQQEKVPDNKWCSSYREQRLWDRARERSKTCSKASCEDHRFHGG